MVSKWFHTSKVVQHLIHQKGKNTLGNKKIFRKTRQQAALYSSARKSCHSSGNSGSLQSAALRPFYYIIFEVKEKGADQTGPR